MPMKKFIMNYMPIIFQNLAITIFNTWQYRKRHSGRYKYYRGYFHFYESAPDEKLAKEVSLRLKEFLGYASEKSSYYKAFGAKDISGFPILEKETLLNNLDGISTVTEKEGSLSLTGGTTGASMKVLYTSEDIQERHAMLDHFRAKYGYTLGKKVAWFSGKDLTRQKDLDKGICYRDDWFNKIRFFSTFHIHKQYIHDYWKAFNQFSPEFIVGFPSSVYDMCVLAKEFKLTFKGKVKAFFPTAETVLPQHREIIEEVLGCPLIDQYASSEGAPFILQCPEGRLHIHPLTGVFEVVDADMKPAREGEILVTSFSTRGTPLIRYRIGDRIRLASANDSCKCGSSFPLVDFIDGRSSDFIYSPENGKVNLGNISNCTKDAPGIICFQVLQDEIDKVRIKIVKGIEFSEEEEACFLDALKKRLGTSMSIKLEYVDEIPREKSGKFRIVKNTLDLKNLG